VIGLIGLVLVSININQFASRSASPGSLYSYISKGLGPTAGVICGWSLVLAYLFTGMSVLCGFANFSSVLIGHLGCFNFGGLSYFRKSWFSCTYFHHR
jgi:amino acid transporter